MIALAVVSGIAFGGGWQVNGWRLGEKIKQVENQHANAVIEAEKASKAAVTRAREIERLQNEKSNAVEAAAQARREASQARARTVTQEVIRYVQRPTDCRVDSEWVRIHDIAAHSPADSVSANAGTSAEFDGSAASLGDALIVVTDNYAICHESRERLIGLQEWITTALRAEISDG